MKKITVFCCITFGMNVSGMENLPFYANNSYVSYLRSIEGDLSKFQNQNESLIEENMILKKKVKDLEEEGNIREGYTGEVEKECDNEKNKNKELLKVLSKKDQEIKELREKIEILSLPTEKRTEVVLNFNDRKEIPEDLKQNMTEYISYLQQAAAKIQSLEEANEALKEQIFNMNPESSISVIEEPQPSDEIQDELSDQKSSISVIEESQLSDEIQDELSDQNSSSMILKDLDPNDWGLFFNMNPESLISVIEESQLSDEIQDKLSDQNSSSMILKDLDPNDWGLFFRKDSTTDSEDFLQLKEDSFLINGKLIDDTFSLSHEGDYIRFGFEHWRNKLVEFKLTDDIFGEFSLSKSDFLNRQQLSDWVPCCYFLISSQKEGKDDSVIITKDFVYKGESESYAPNGEGVMLKNTGEVLSGKFENGKFIR